MNWAAWLSRWLPISALAVTLLAALDPLEGFPLVLMGGVLAVMAAIQNRSAYTQLVIIGFLTASIGCAAMVVLSAVGGVGEIPGRSRWWLGVIAPYPIGVVLYVISTVFILRERTEQSHVERR